MNFLQSGSENGAKYLKGPLTKVFGLLLDEKGALWPDTQECPEPTLSHLVTGTARSSRCGGREQTQVSWNGGGENHAGVLQEFLPPQSVWKWPAGQSTRPVLERSVSQGSKPKERSDACLVNHYGRRQTRLCPATSLH